MPAIGNPRKDGKLEKNNKIVCEFDRYIGKYYEIKKRIGKGAYGVVWKAVDRRSQLTVAVKKIFDAFQNPTDAQRTFREILFLREFKEHPNIVKLLAVHKALNDHDIYLVFEYMDVDLHHVIKKGNMLTDLHKRYITYQLLKALKYIHSGNVIHRDLKPSNILLNSHCTCKVADFGLARSLNSDEDMVSMQPALTDYVATRWYRAPEILVASKSYTKGIDIWSLGCILGEMLLGKPLFPGNSTVHQMELVMATIPKPSNKDIETICPGYGSSLLTKSPKARTSLGVLLDGCPLDGVDLVRKCLVFNPLTRTTASSALSHPFVAKFHNHHDEMSLNYKVKPLVCDNVQLSVNEYRATLYKLIDSSGSVKLTKPAKLSKVQSCLSVPQTADLLPYRRSEPTLYRNPPRPDRPRELRNSKTAWARTRKYQGSYDSLKYPAHHHGPQVLVPKHAEPPRPHYCPLEVSYHRCCPARYPVFCPHRLRSGHLP